MTTPTELQKAIDWLQSTAQPLSVHIVLRELAALQKRVEVANERLTKVEQLFVKRINDYMKEGAGCWVVDENQCMSGPTFLEAIDSLPTPKTKGDSMTEQEMNIAIAEACGWKPTRPLSQETEAPPSYTTDLNAMHFAEQILDKKQLNIYVGYLMNKREYTCLCSAHEKAEAFVKTLNLWN